MKKIKNIALGTIILLFLISVYYVIYTYAEPKAYDFMMRNVVTRSLPFDGIKNNTGSSDINLIVIDDKTETKYRWPWKREMYCKIFEYLHEYAKPKLVVYDMLVLSLDKDNPQSDRKFFNTLDKFDNLVVGFRPTYEDWSNKELGKKYSDKFAEKFAIKNVENFSTQKYDLYYSLTMFPEEYLKVIKNTGSVSIVQGFISGNLSYHARDDVFRNYSYAVRYDGNVYPSMALQAFLKLKNNPKMIIKDNEIVFPEINFKIPQRTSTYQMTTPLKFYNLSAGDYSHKKYSAVDIMDSYDNIKHGKKPIIDPKEFENKIVFIGANVISGAGLNDNLSTPVNETFPGVEYLATATDNLINNDFLKIIPDWANMLIALFCMTLVYCIIKLSDLYKAIFETLVVILVYLMICMTCFYYSVVINVLTPVVMIILTMIGAYIHRYVVESRNKAKVESAMSKYMSEDVMKNVIKNIDNLGLGGKKAVVTVLFSDIRGFTSMSETMSAQEVSEILNEYFSEMEPIVRKYNGIINKFIGDAVMAVFGEPIQDENHPLNAVKCGYEMLLKVKELQNKWSKEGKPKIEIGIGVNTGEVFVGNIGSVNRMEYTVIGDTVNLASRLESYNKTYGTKMLISPATYNMTMSHIETNKISDVEIRGKSQKIDIYEVCGVKI